jgi:hypothetical protein
MRAESTPLFRHAQLLMLYFAVAGICIAIAAYLLAVVSGGVGTDVVPETLFTAPFRWGIPAGEA